MNPRSVVVSGFLAMGLLGGCMTPAQKKPVVTSTEEKPVRQSASALQANPAPRPVPLVDVVRLESCDELTGRILRETESTVVLQQEQGEQSIPRADITLIRRDQTPSPGTAPGQPMTTGRLVNSGLIIETFASISRAKDLEQVPSEVIDNGPFHHVPYLSYRADQFELNIYGDPRQPSGVEIGVYAGKASTKQEIRNLMARLLQLADDRELVGQLSLDQDKLERAGLTFEITPPTAPDAFGGWWISFYDACAIAKARASDAELHAISEEAPNKESPAPKETRNPLRKKKDMSDRVYIMDYSKENGAYVPAEPDDAP